MDQHGSWTDPDRGRPPEELVVERARRLDDALAMRRPDRIPIQFGPGYLLAEMGGVPHAALFEDRELSQRLLEQAAAQFAPDAMGGVWSIPGPSEALGERMTKWPGFGLGPDGSFQFHEHEFMRAADYDAFLFDHTDWAVRTYLPRAYEKLEGLALLPPLGMTLFGYYNLVNLGVLATAPVVEALEALAEAARRQRDQGEWVAKCVDRLRALGIPPVPWRGSLVEAPFDFLSDTLRGMRGIFLDLRQRPEQLLAAEEKALRIQVEYARHVAAATGRTYTSIPLHRGSDGFMSIVQFERFYWPQLKDMIVQLVDAGITPNVFYEGVWDQRLEYLRELPAGKTIGMFQSSDIFRVKEVLGDVMCVMGGMPTSLLRAGPASAIRERTHEVCERVGAGGGFVMIPSINEMEGCDPDLIQVWVGNRDPRDWAFSGRPCDIFRRCCRRARRNRRVFSDRRRTSMRLSVPARQAYSHSASVGSR